MGWGGEVLPPPPSEWCDHKLFLCVVPDVLHNFLIFYLQYFLLLFWISGSHFWLEKYSVIKDDVKQKGQLATYKRETVISWPYNLF